MTTDEIRKAISKLNGFGPQDAHDLLAVIGSKLAAHLDSEDRDTTQCLALELIDVASDECAELADEMAAAAKRTEQDRAQAYADAASFARSTGAAAAMRGEL